jgi:hypothetical protein
MCSLKQALSFGIVLLAKESVKKKQVGELQEYIYLLSLF